MNTFAEIKKLSIAFQSKGQFVTAVQDLNFELHRGETMALLGESGCGKSLTSLALMRLLPTKAFYGKTSEVRLNDQDILELPEILMRSLRGRKIAMIFQEPMTALNPVLTIGEQLIEIFQKNSSQTKGLKQRMIELLQEVEMPDPKLRLKQYPHQLSGGQKQRVVIAMALAANPDLLIADEPTTALDVTVQAQILKLLKKIQQQYQMSMLLITHDLGVVKTMAHRVSVMYAGQIVEQSSVSEFFEHILHPYVQQLLASLPDFKKRGQRLQAITGAVPTLDALPEGCRFHPRCAHAFSLCALKEPQLQTIKGREVRCHLYPQLQHLTALTTATETSLPLLESKELLLTVKDLVVHFPLKRQLFLKTKEWIKAVDHLSFQLIKGKTLALVGESGCGKTTTARALLGLQAITSGEVCYRGQNLRSMTKRALNLYRKQVQIIFQDPFSSMNPRMTVTQILSEGLLAQGFNNKFIQKKLRSLLEQVNLPRNSLDRYPHQFSGGQRQRICIARALATEPELLICDEPTSALDISVQAQILNLLKDLQRERGLSYLFITHNMSVVSYMADEVLVMHQGKVVEEGPCERVLFEPKENYTRQLLASVLSKE